MDACPAVPSASCCGNLASLDGVEEADRLVCRSDGWQGMTDTERQTSGPPHLSCLLGLMPFLREAFSLVELRATAHHLGHLVAAGGGDSNSDQSVSDPAFGAHAGGHGVGRRGGGGGGGGAWGDVGSADDFEDDWGVEYAWSAQGGGRHHVPSLVERMPQAICTNYLRVRMRTHDRLLLRSRRGQLCIPSMPLVCHDAIVLRS